MGGGWRVRAEKGDGRVRVEARRQPTTRRERKHVPEVVLDVFAALGPALDVAVLLDGEVPNALGHAPSLRPSSDLETAIAGGFEHAPREFRAAHRHRGGVLKRSLPSLQRARAFCGGPTQCGAQGREALLFPASPLDFVRVIPKEFACSPNKARPWAAHHRHPLLAGPGRVVLVSVKSTGACARNIGRSRPTRSSCTRKAGARARMVARKNP